MITKNMIGAKKMCQNGQKVPYWMLCSNSLDALNWAKFTRLFNRKMRGLLCL